MFHPSLSNTISFFVGSFEIQLLSMKYLEHENVLKANGVSLDNNRNPVLILPYVVNGDLAAYLRRESQPLCYSQEIADLLKIGKKPETIKILSKK